MYRPERYTVTGENQRYYLLMLPGHRVPAGRRHARTRPCLFHKNLQERIFFLSSWAPCSGEILMVYGRKSCLYKMHLGSFATIYWSDELHIRQHPPFFYHGCVLARWMLQVKPGSGWWRLFPAVRPVRRLWEQNSNLSITGQKLAARLMLPGGCLLWDRYINPYED